MEPKDVVGVFIDDSFDYFVQFIALSGIGAVPAFINSKLPAEIAARYLQRIEAVLVVATKERLEGMKDSFGEAGSATKLLDLNEILKQPAPTTLPEQYPYIHHDSDPVLLTHTSGTTGTPKAVIAAHQPYIHGVKFRLKNPTPHITRYLSALPHSHNSGIAYLMEASLRGCPVWVQSDKSAESMAQTISEFKPDFVVAFPKIFVDMYRADIDPEKLRSVFYWRSTGDAVHERHVKYITRWGSHEENGEIKPGSIYIDGLGSSEMGSSLFTVYHDHKKRDYDRCVGKPHAWVNAQVLDTRGNLLGPGEVGRLGIKSPSLTLGYWNNTGMTEKFRSQGFWITGDLVYKDALGYFYHMDRITDKIDTDKGVVFSLQTEEFIMKQFEEIFDCSIYSDLDDQGNAVASIRVDMVDTASQEQLENLLQRINQRLTECQKPALYAISTTSSKGRYAPEGITGKVLKRVLRLDDAAEVKVATVHE